MVDITKTDVLAIAPGLNVTDEAWTDILAYVNELDLAPLGETDQVTRMARMYLAAHFATVSGQATTGGGAAVAGPVVQESAGGIMRKYATSGGGSSSSASSSTSDLRSTMYGQLYMSIIGMSGARGPLVI